jgi:hypothetical protein
VVYGNLGGVLRLLGKSLESVMAYEAVRGREGEGCQYGAAAVPRASSN